MTPYTCSSEASDNTGNNVIVAVVATLRLLLTEGINVLMIATAVVSCFRRDKLNSQFIVTKTSILHAGGRSFFIRAEQERSEN